MEEETSSIEKSGIPVLHFSVQLQNVFVVEVIAKHFPVNVRADRPPKVETILGLEGINVDEATSIAQAILSVQILPKDEPPLFEISFKLVGIFIYSNDYSPEMVHTFLEQGSLSVMLPFARELLLSLCTRLQIPAILLPMIPIASASIGDTREKDVH